MTDVDRKTKTKNIIVRCLRPYKGYGLLREIVASLRRRNKTQPSTNFRRKSWMVSSTGVVEASSVGAGRCAYRICFQPSPLTSLTTKSEQST